MVSLLFIYTVVTDLTSISLDDSIMIDQMLTCIGNQSVRTSLTVVPIATLQISRIKVKFKNGVLTTYFGDQGMIPVNPATIICRQSRSQAFNGT